MSDTRYQVIEHTADLGIEVHAQSIEAVFGCAAEAMFALMGTPTTAGAPVTLRAQADGVDHEDLLVGVLTELLAQLELEGRFLTRARQVTITRDAADRLWVCAVEAEGVAIDRTRERDLVEFKAVTYHDLHVHCDDEGCRARVIFDL